MTSIETRRPATIEDLRALPSETLAELLCGELFINPAPNMDHQAVVGATFAALRAHVHASRSGRVWVAPVDVFLPTGDVAQPDVVYVGDARGGIVRPDAIHGAPDLVIEVLSPAGAARDRIVKREIYARSGVSEYWIIDPTSRTVDVYSLSDDRYADARVHGTGHAIESSVLPALALPVARVFEDI